MHTVLRTSILNTWNNFLTAKRAVFNLGRSPPPSSDDYQIANPQNVVLIVSSMSLFADSIINGAYNEFIGVNLTIFATRCDSLTDLR